MHGTNFVQVENNVTYNTVGHCFFLEDGIEHGNQFVHNLAIQTKCHTCKPCVPTNLAAAGESPNSMSPGQRANGQASKDVLLPSDNTVSSFWITNPDNFSATTWPRAPMGPASGCPCPAPARPVPGTEISQDPLAASHAVP